MNAEDIANEYAKTADVVGDQEDHPTVVLARALLVAVEALEYYSRAPWDAGRIGLLRGDYIVPGVSSRAYDVLAKIRGGTP